MNLCNSFNQQSFQRYIFHCRRLCSGSLYKLLLLFFFVFLTFSYISFCLLFFWPILANRSDWAMLTRLLLAIIFASTFNFVLERAHTRTFTILKYFHSLYFRYKCLLLLFLHWKRIMSTYTHIIHICIFS